MKAIALVGVGGAVGSILRYIVAIGIKQIHFPYATMLVNIIGSVIIGMENIGDYYWQQVYVGALPLSLHLPGKICNYCNKNDMHIFVFMREVH
jgi:hypothetical protein